MGFILSHLSSDNAHLKIAVFPRIKNKDPLLDVIHKNREEVGDSHRAHERCCTADVDSVHAA